MKSRLRNIEYLGNLKFERKNKLTEMGTVLIEEIYDAPREKVWKALTAKEEMRHWYFDLPDFKLEVGFEFSFEGEGRSGDRYIHLCRITEVVPGSRVQYSWEYRNIEGSSTVTFDLEAENNSTKIKLTHAGLETFPQDNPDLKIQSFEGGWKAIISDLLPKYLENA